MCTVIGKIVEALHKQKVELLNDPEILVSGSDSYHQNCCLKISLLMSTL